MRSMKKKEGCVLDLKQLGAKAANAIAASMEFIQVVEERVMQKLAGLGELAGAMAGFRDVTISQSQFAVATPANGPPSRNEGRSV